MCSASSRWAISSRFLSSASDQGVEQHRGEQNPALECEGPVAVPLCIDDSELDHPEHRGAEERADYRAEAAGEQTAADYGTDDEDELQPDAFGSLHRTQLQGLDDPHQRGGAGRHHEECDLGTSNGNA